MKNTPGFLLDLQKGLEALTLDELNRVNRSGGLEVRDLIDLVLHPEDHTVHLPDQIDDSILKKYEDISAETTSRGHEALHDGTTAFCVLAGGAGTRAGTSKALLKLPVSGKSLLQIKLEQSNDVRDVWVMVSPDNRLEIEKHIATIGLTHRVKVFTQYESFRLTPDNRLSVIDGSAELHPCGHGDLIPALQHSGILRAFLASGGKRVMVVNVDNVLAAPSDRIVGQHIEGKKPVTCEVTDRLPREGGGILCSHAGFDQIVEKFRMSPYTETEDFKWVNTNTMVFDASLDFESIVWSWHRVKKNVDNRLVVQHERLLQELTAHFQTQYVSSKREERFMPVKTQDDLLKVARIFGE